MISLIIKKEILENVSTLRFVFLTLFCIVLIPLSLYFNYKTYKTHLSDYRETVRLHQEKLNTVYVRKYPEKMKGFRPPSALMVFAHGLEDALPQWATSTKSGPEFGKAISQQEAIQVFVTNVDFHFIIKFIFSLVALLFSFNLICGEKEKGTLRQNLANALPRHQLLLGKMVGSYIVLIIPFLLSLTLGLLLLIILGPELVRGDNILCIISIVFTSLLYISVFFMLGLLITTKTKNSITALVVLLFLWIIILFVIPGLSNILAKIVHPVKTEQVLNLEKELVQKQINYSIAMNDDVYSKIWRDEYIDESSSSSQGGYYEVPPREVTPFKFQKHPFSESLFHSWVDMLLLVIYNFLFFVGSYVAFLRYDVR